LLEHATPGTDVHFVNRHGFVEPVMVLALGHPFLIVPSIVEVPNNRCGPGRNLIERGKRVGFVDPIAAHARANVILIQSALADAGNEAFPNAGAGFRRKRLAGLVPIIEIADDRNLFRVGRPDGEVSAAFTGMLHDMGAELVIETKMAALIE
jgi:hypothetical protein